MEEEEEETLLLLLLLLLKDTGGRAAGDHPTEQLLELLEQLEQLELLELLELELLSGVEPADAPCMGAKPSSWPNAAVPSRGADLAPKATQAAGDNS